MKNKQSILSISLLAALSLTSPVTATAQNETRWHNVDVNQQNREPRRAAFFAFEDLSKAQCFFKQKTAYDIVLSDWSSDVCSSDLRTPRM